MTSLMRLWALPLFAFAIAVFIVMPSSVAASSSSHNDYGTLTVRVIVDNDYNYNHNRDHRYSYEYDYSYGTYDRSPSDFLVIISGGNPSRNYFRGSSSGTEVDLRGYYSVSISNLFGYRPSYSAGCTGDVERKDTPSCTITLMPPYYAGGYYPSQPPYYAPQTYYPTYTPPITYVQSYVPGFPNTGFEPVDAAALAFAVVLLIGAGVYFLPYVRKTIATVLG